LNIYDRRFGDRRSECNPFDETFDHLALDDLILFR